MSGIYIPDMEMPKICGGCFALGFRIKEGNMVDYCLRLDREIPLYNLDEVRMNDCPLKEVPNHGDLIDRQKLLEHRFEVYDSNEEVCEDYIETYHVLEAPAIIEAST